MIIPTLVLVSAMQFGDPQSGQRIDDLSHSPWREVSVVMSVTAQSNEIPERPIVPTMNMPPFPSESEQNGYFYGNAGTFPGDGNIVPDSGYGSVSGMTMPMPSDHFTALSTDSQRPTQSGGSSGTSFLVVQNSNDYGGPTRIENGKAYLSRARVRFDKIARLSAPIGGIILEQSTVKRDVQGNVLRDSSGEPIPIELERGVLLFAGQQVAQLDDRYPQAQFAVAKTKLAVAKKEAEQTIGMDYAEASLLVAESDYRRKWDIDKRAPGTVTAAEFEIAAFKVKEARLQLDKARIDHENQQESVKVQEEEVRVAQTQLDLRKVKTPFNGMVVNVVSQVGNYLRESDAIAEVAQLDKLKILANVDGTMITQEQVNKKKVTVTVRNPGGQVDEFDGSVRYAAPIFDRLRRFEVEIVVNNRLVNGSWLLKEGDFVDVVIDLKD